MDSTHKDIINYIEFLRETGFLVMLSCFNPVLGKYLPELIKYESHLPMVCSYLKSKPDTRRRCIKNKQQLVDCSPRETYYGCCWAGVEEYVIPIIHEDALVCCINLSGYRGKLDKSEALSDKLAKKLGKDFANKYLQLSTTVPDITTVQTIANPLKYMFSALYDECFALHNKNYAPEDIYIHILKYINKHYMEKLKISNIAEAMNYSPSYLRYIFLKQSGRTITEHINSTRLTHAANLLKFTKNSITDIALDCGFSDSNYFSTAFKKQFGVSPTKYRKNLTRNT